MKRLLISTAMGLMLTTSAFAEAHSGAMKTYQTDQANDLYASELIGMRIYSAEKEYDSFNADTRVGADAEQEWDDIGEVNDVILGRDGQVKAVILGVGGFIGIGEKDVAASMDSIKFVKEDGEAGDFFLVVKTNADALTEAPAYERDTEESMKRTNETADAEMSRPMLTAPEIEREGYQTATADQLTTENLTGARVYDAQDEDIGEVSELILSDSGQLKEAVLDIGGFLGLGEHQIAVTMKELNIMRNQDGDDVRVYIQATQEELEAQPEYEG